MPLRRQELETFREQMEALKTETSSRLIIICGAGVTRASVAKEYEEKFSWSGLIKQGLLEVQKNKTIPKYVADFITSEKNYRTEQLLDFASFIQNNLKKNQYANWLRNNVGNAVRWDSENSNKQVLLKALVECAEIEKVSLATTNYDYLLSRAQGWTPSKGEGPFKPINWRENVVLSSWSRGTAECRQKVLHLHGDALDADSVIFSNEDYERLNTNDWTIKIREVLALNHVVMFVGCGGTLEDPAFKKILDLYDQNIGANCFNQRWFKLASSSEEELIGVNKLTYGDNYDDLPIFVRDVLLPLLKTHLAKTETGKNETTKVVENNQTPLLLPTEIGQTENAIDVGNNQSPPIEIVTQPPLLPIASDVQNEESDLLKKAIIELSKKLLTKHRLVVDLLVQPDNNSNNNNSFINWLETEKPDDKFAAVVNTWRELKLKNNEIWLEANEFLMLLAIHSLVQKENYKNIDVYQSHTGHDKFADYILPILVAINIKYGIGCNLEKVDNKWLSNNLILKSKTTPLEAYKYNKTPREISTELSKIARIPLAYFDNDEVKAYVNNYKKSKNANIALVYDDDTLTENQLYQIKEWGILTIQSNSDEVDENFEKIFNNLIKQFNHLDLSFDDGEKNKPKGESVAVYNFNAPVSASIIGDNGTVNITFNESNLISNLDELLKINIQIINDRKEEIIELKRIIEEKRRDSSSLEKVKKAKEWIELYTNAPQIINEGIESTGKLKNLLLPILSNLSTFL